MKLSWLESLIYGVISGLTEFLPVSSVAHQAIVLRQSGLPGGAPFGKRADAAAAAPGAEDCVHPPKPSPPSAGCERADGKPGAAHGGLDHPGGLHRLQSCL